MAWFPRGWNHNSLYHRQVLRRVPDGCRRAADLGSGDGTLTALASLHHEAFAPALERAGRLVRPGGTLIVLGIWTDDRSVADKIRNRAAGSVNRSYQLLWGLDAMDAPARAPDIGLEQVRSITRRVLPGSTIRRYLLWRYLLTWRKPG